MSRAVFYDVNGYAAGELHGFVNRGWTLVGDTTIQSGAQTTLKLSADQASLSWLQFGKIVLVQHATLPAWVGMMDPPWTALLPGSLTLYNIEYLLNQRAPDAAVDLTGTTAQIVQKMIEMINAQEETHLRLGDVEADASRVEKLDQRTFWAQLTDILGRSAMEMAFRPAIVNSQLFVYMDIKTRIGADKSFVFHDGQNANMRVTKAEVSGPIWNRVIGINDKSTGAGRLATGPQVDNASVNKYRLRSTVQQFSGVADQSTLDRYTRNYLAVAARPLLTLNIEIEDKGDAFKQVGVGNAAMFRVANIYLPGGVRGFSGTMRMKAVAYDEASNVVGMTVSASL